MNRRVMLPVTGLWQFAGDRTTGRPDLVVIAAARMAAWRD
jgi:hypothetical protein